MSIAVTHLAEALRVVGVTAHQRRHVERDGQSAAPAVQDHLVALVGLLGIAEAGELTDRPCASAVSGRVQTACERELARPADLLEVRVPRFASLASLARIGGTVRRLDLHAGQRGEVSLADARLGVTRLPPLACALG